LGYLSTEAGMAKRAIGWLTTQQGSHEDDAAPARYEAIFGPAKRTDTV
jgi:hypothetical protein